MGVSRAAVLVVLGLLLAAVLLRIFAKPLHLALKLLINTLLGFLALFLFGLLEPLLGVSLGLNLFNAVVIGILGLPGFLLLLLLQWIL
ncbi:MAG: pro-sigmaK processing inhibitor BofA family protein [Oscillospiraceae bacterium]